MGLFSRKSSKASTKAQADTSSIQSGNSGSLSITSPTTSKPMNGQSSPYIPSTPAIPEINLPKPPPALDPAGYLRSIHAVRERAKIVFEKAKRNELRHFHVEWDKFQDTAAYVTSIIKRDFAPDFASIPPHGRWQHFEVGGRPRIDQLLKSWSSVDSQERCRRLLDLFVVSVLIDAGAGSRWQYKSSESGRFYRRSEGLAVASLEMFKSGIFSSDPDQPYQVDGQGLKKLTTEALMQGLQVTDKNPMDGVEGRASLLIKLGDALKNQEFFGVDARPGNMLDYLLSHSTTQASSVPIVALPTLWSVVMDGFGSIWPTSRTMIDGISLGDAWPCNDLPESPPARPWESIVPFHKLSQWMTYSLMVPMTRLLHIHFAGTELMTGLPEYRNGGLLVDTGLLVLKDDAMDRGIINYNLNSKLAGQPNVEVVPLFGPDDDAVVEWRALTVGFLDELLVEVNKALGLSGSNRLSLAQMLEAGTWKGGRELAEVSRPNTKEPPIMIISDGTVF